MKICENCSKWRTASCCIRRETGHDSGWGDWCLGWKKTNPRVAEPIREVLDTFSRVNIWDVPGVKCRVGETTDI